MNEYNEPSKMNSLINLRSEAAVVGVLSISLYIFTFSSQRAYLGYFGIDEMFVAIDLSSLIRGGIWVLGYTAIVYQVFLLPRAFYSNIFKWIVALKTLVFPLIIFLILLRFSGVTWVSVSLFSLTVFSGLFLLFNLFLKLRDGEGFKGFVTAQIDQEITYSQSQARTIIEEKFGGDLWSVVILAFILPYFLGIMLGSIEASKKQSFIVYDVGEEQFAIIHEDSKNYLSVSYRLDTDASAVLTGRVNFHTSEMLSSINFKSMTLRGGVARNMKPRERQSYLDWWQNDFLKLFEAELALEPE